MITKFFEFHNPFDEKTFLPAVTVADLTYYYQCKNCGALFKSFDKPQVKCPYCSSENIKRLDVDTWYNLTSKRLDKDELSYHFKEKEKEKTTLIDLTELGKFKEYKKLRRNIN